MGLATSVSRESTTGVGMAETQAGTLPLAAI